MKYLAPFALTLMLSACVNESGTDTASEEAAAIPEFSVSDSGVKTKNVEGFDGVIAASYSDSEEWWAAEKRPKEGSPNVIIFLLDDVGFAQVGRRLNPVAPRCS